MENSSRSFCFQLKIGQIRWTAREVHAFHSMHFQLGTEVVAASEGTAALMKRFISTRELNGTDLMILKKRLRWIIDGPETGGHAFFASQKVRGNISRRFLGAKKCAAKLAREIWVPKFVRQNGFVNFASPKSRGNISRHFLAPKKHAALLADTFWFPKSSRQKCRPVFGNQKRRGTISQTVADSRTHVFGKRQRRWSRIGDGQASSRIELSQQRNEMRKSQTNGRPKEGGASDWDRTSDLGLMSPTL